MYHQKRWYAGKAVFLTLLFACALIFAAAGSSFAASVNLAWNAASGVSGYKVNYGTASGNYTSSINAGNATTGTVSGLTDGVKYYFAITAYDASGVQSDYSNEVSSGGTTSSCTYSISPASASFTSSGGSGNIAVSTGSGCSWSASTGVTWGTISAGSSGSGSGTVSYKVAANTGSSRTASFSVAGKIFTISQSGASSSTSGSASYTVTTSAGTGGYVSPNGLNYAGSGSSKTISIRPYTGYSISYVLVDGVSVGAVSSYTFSNITASHTLSARFK